MMIVDSGLLFWATLYKQQVFSTCDWLLFLFTIITLRSLMMKLRRIYDEVMTILRS